MMDYIPGFVFSYPPSNGESEMSAKHPGFKKVQSNIEKEGYSKKAAGAILASKTRSASPAAKKKNPNLKKVKGK